MDTTNQDEPVARRTIFAGFRYAAEDLFGSEGHVQIGRVMSEEARLATVEPVVLSKEFLPERYVLAWYDAVWEGPAQRELEVFHQFMDRMMDHGFGRVRRIFLRAVTPAGLFQKALPLWRHDHNTGDLSVPECDDAGAMLELRDHVYCDTPLARTAIAEIYRYAASLTRAKQVSSRHHVTDEGIIRVHLTWS